MKITSKFVDFHGILLPVSDDAVAVAADENGRVFEYYGSLPTASPIHWIAKNFYFAPLCTVDLEGMDWKETLIRLDK